MGISSLDLNCIDYFSEVAVLTVDRYYIQEENDFIFLLDQVNMVTVHKGRCLEHRLRCTIHEDNATYLKASLCISGAFSSDVLFVSN